MGGHLPPVRLEAQGSRFMCDSPCLSLSRRQEAGLYPHAIRRTCGRALEKAGEDRCVPRRALGR